MRLLILLFAFSTSVIATETINMIQLRTLYYSSSEDQNTAKEFLETTSQLDVDANSLFLAYRGMAYMLQAKYAWNPYSKMNNFDKGKQDLEKAIEKDQSNVELRFLRFGIQTNVPSILSYSDNIEADKKMILEAFQNIQDKDLKQRIKEYLITSDALSDAEKNTLKG